MTHKPVFWLAFKALTQIRELLGKEMMNRFFAYNSYYFAFNDQKFVNENVLVNVPGADQIYSDSLYGLNSVSGLFQWIQLNSEGMKSSVMYNEILSYFKDKGVTLTDQHMDQIAGSKSFLAQTKNVVKGNLSKELKVK